MSAGWAVANALQGLAATSFVWSSGFTTSRNRLNDTIQDELASSAASAVASGQTLAFDLGSAQALSGVALLNHNLATGACAVKVEGADDSAFTVNLVTAKAASTINTTAPYDKDTVLQFPSTTKRWWRLTFTHTGTKVVTLGELLALGTITTLSRNYIYGNGETEKYILNRGEMMTGNVRSTFLAGPIRTKRMPFKDLQGTSQRNELMAWWRATRGGNLNTLLVENIESTATAATSTAMQCIWGYLQEELGWTEDDSNLYGVDALTLVGQGREAGS